MSSERPYPARLHVEYQEQHDRLSVAFRPILWIPLAIMISLLNGGEGGSLLLAFAAVVFFRQYIPHWLFDYQVNLFQFSARSYAYLALLTDRYPAFESEYPVNVSVDYPESVSRWKALVWKLVSGIPHFVVLFVLGAIAVVLVVVAWFAILFTGKYPRGIFDYVTGVLRWGLRLAAYLFSMTDEYPPFSLE